MVFGSAGFKLLGSRDAKNAYVTAAGLRVKESAMESLTALREGADDILAEAKEVNRQCEVQAEVVEDTSAE